MRIRSLSLKVALFGALLTAAVFAAAGYILIGEVRTKTDSEAANVQRETAQHYAAEVGIRLGRAAAVARAVASTMASLKQAGVSDRSAFDTVLKDYLVSNPDLFATWISGEPEAFGGNDAEFAGKEGYDASGRYVPYWVRSQGNVVRDKLVDYDDAVKGAYSQEPKRLGRLAAIQPYLYKVDDQQVLMMSFGIPSVAGGKHLGTGGIDLRLDDLNKELAAAKPFGVGFVGLVTNTGIAVAHRNPEFVGKPLKAEGQALDAPMAEVAAAAVASGKTEQLSGAGPDGAAWRYVAQPIRAGGSEDIWAVVAAVPQAAIDATVNEAANEMTWIFAAGVIVASIVLLFLLRVLVGGPLRSLVKTVDHLAAGNYDADVAEARRVDEIGLIGQAIASFRDGLRDKAQSEQAEEAEKQAGRARERSQAMSGLADEFERSIGGIVRVVSQAASEMEASAKTLNMTAEDAAHRSEAVSHATVQAAGNVQTVATASEELTSSISEIARQVAQSSEIASRAVAEASRTDERIRGLEAAAQKVGEVVSLIQAIAEQTNLLALNATIEAARAGDSGKGFAVVASEVKQLATQTARATQDISIQIATIQDATRGSVEAIKVIGTTIDEMNRIASSIAGAVQQQGAATQDIANSVTQVAGSTDEVARNIAGVSEATQATGSAATQMLGTAAELSQQSESLGREVESFLGRVRAG